MDEINRQNNNFSQMIKMCCCFFLILNGCNNFNLIQNSIKEKDKYIFNANSFLDLNFMR